MLKISKMSIGGYGIGMLFIIMSMQRYWVRYPDIDRLIAYVTIGSLVIGMSWCYDNLLKIHNTLNHIEEHLADRFK